MDYFFWVRPEKVTFKKTDFMLTLKQLREDAGAAQKLEKKGVADAAEKIARIIGLDDRRKAAQTDLDANLAEQNGIAKSIGQFFKEGKKAEAETLKARTAELKEAAKGLEEEKEAVESDLNAALVALPNLPHDSVPAGQTAEDNEVVRTGGEKPQLPSGAQPHWELIKKYDIIDFDLGTKLTGAGFPLYRRQGAALQRALIAYFLDRNMAAGYEEVMPPLMVNEASGFGTGQLPDKEGQMYHATLDNFYLIPTAEVPVTNIFRDTVLDERDLPIRLTAYTPCFRREAGSYGKDVRGLNRLHQFDKVEIVQLTTPEKSYDALEGMVSHVESLVRELELPYRILRLCGGDMSFTSALTYDFEVWSAAQERWLEVSSVSNFESFQANRLKARYKGEDKKTRLVHTLNGSSLALPRIVAAILENNQTPEGIRIPKALVPYTKFDIIK